MRLDLRSPKTFIIFFASFAAGFTSFLLIENASQFVPGSATAQTAAQSETMTAAQLNKKVAQQANAESSADTAVSQSSAAEPKAGEFRPEPGKTVETEATEVAIAPTETVAESNRTNAALTEAPETLAGVIPPQDAAAPVSNRPTLRAQSAQPGYEIAWADPTNYGERFTRDVYNQPATQQPIIVLHETVSSADSAINYFQTPHPNDADQASYHTLIRRNGVVVYLVPPEKRAYGAGNSVFVGADGSPETIKTHKQFSASVNNFAYHISLESPPDGYGNGPSHSGYSQAQYNSLAWLIGQSTVPLDRITTHQRVDRSGERSDPRSFDFRRLQSALRPYRRF